ncbi:hypothetical protein [Sphaerotilus uruguayifluvii]|uniref:Uncharacterized protein n=1 Tax=Sphaerotilus uruguayifluvii TaxID=2735897 RepID=A0ABX2G9F1_9BURK|nr:hypothetical protein [Leptothrix sp. C29]NRT58092.1 hypothetical protein [Leptothrix sp. C29]
MSRKIRRDAERLGFAMPFPEVHDPAQLKHKQIQLPHAPAKVTGMATDTHLDTEVARIRSHATAQGLCSGGRGLDTRNKDRPRFAGVRDEDRQQQFPEHQRSGPGERDSVQDGDAA